MAVTLSGMTTEVRAEHEKKACWSMAVTLFGMTTEVRAELSGGGSGRNRPGVMQVEL